MTVPALSGPSPTSGGPAPHPARVHPRRPAEPRTYITTRQIDILLLAANGNTNGAIARTLGVGIDAINSQWLLIRRKLRAGDRTHAVAVALRLGLLAMNDITIPEGANHGYRNPA